MGHSDIHREIAENAGSLFRERLGISAMASRTGKGMPRIDDEGWRELAELGWLGLLVPEEAGGIGLGAVEAAALCREAGRHLVSAQMLWTLLASTMACAAGEVELTRKLISGDVRAGLRTADFAIDAREGDLLLSIGDAGAQLANLRSAEPIDPVDPGTCLVRVLEDREVVKCGGPSLQCLARILVSATLLGIIEAARDMSADYAKTREQFGKPIGTFQVVKHRCADMAIAALAVRAQIMMAAQRHDAGKVDANFHAACALQLASGRASRTTADNIQNHGALGFTAEHGAHLLVKRALVLERALGTRDGLVNAVLAPAHHEFF